MSPDYEHACADPSYPENGGGATARLTQGVMAKIEANGPISFTDFFNYALYEPNWGYYSSPENVRTGKKGDFFTSVSVGPLFGRILAQYAYLKWVELEQPSCFRVVEWGAEQGHLAQDFIQGVHELEAEFAEAFQYAIVEPLERKRRDLERRLPKVRVVQKSSELDAQCGFVVANELIDALAFFLVRWEGGKWWEKRVTSSESHCFEFVLSEPNPILAQRLTLINGKFTEGYETEVRPSQSQLLNEMSSVLVTGELLFFDYGYARNDYYHPSRTTGTLRTYREHQAGEDPLKMIGQQDITAHVDFDALAEDALAAGLNVSAIESQGRFLTKAASSILTSMDGRVDSEFIRQFQTLTHPAHLGTRFSVLRAHK